MPLAEEPITTPTRTPPAAAPNAPSTVPAEPARAAAKPTPATPILKPGRLPPYRVLLHNDEAVEMDHVVRSLITVVSLRFEPAVNVMLEAHRSGVALVATTHRELAELYAEGLESAGLTATIEPA